MFIKLKPELFEKIVDKKKHATTRRGDKEIRRGSAFFYNPDDASHRLLVEITNVEKTSWANIKRKNFLFIDEGYETKEEFHKALFDIYGSIGDDETMTVAWFKCKYYPL